MRILEVFKFLTLVFALGGYVLLALLVFARSPSALVRRRAAGRGVKSRTSERSLESS
jgi:hypothetical protein